MAPRLAYGLLAGLALLTRVHLPVWQDDRALWTSAVRIVPHSPRASLNLAATYAPNEHHADACYWLGQARRSAQARHDRPALAIVTNQALWISAFSLPCDF